MRIIGGTALLRQILVVLYLYGIIIFALLIGGASVLVAYERQPERLFFQTLTYDGKKWTRKKAIAVRNKDLQERYDYAEKHSLAYAAPFYLRCCGMPEILEPEFVGVEADEDCEYLEHKQD